MNDEILPNLRIGLEIHVQLQTNTKLFSASENNSLSEPNSLISALDVGVPGSLPRINQQAVEKAVTAGIHLNCKIHQQSYFDRKHYNYPDLPLGYQITQFYYPFATDGSVAIDENFAVKIARIHMETDAGKLLHEDVTLLDFNRCGCPLIEIVTQPDFTSISQIDRFLNILAQTLKYAKVSDCNMYLGNLRVDVNLSIDKPDGSYGDRVEIKNLNSFKSIRSAIVCEYNRQKDIVDNGGTVPSETRLFDTKNNVTKAMRKKEDAKDYMYMPDGNIPMLDITDQHLESIKQNSPETFNCKKEKLNTLTNNQEIIQTILFNEKLMYILEEALEYPCKDKDLLCKIIAMELVNHLDKSINYAHIVTLCNLRSDNRINNTLLKQIIEEVINNNVDPIEYITVNQLEQITSVEQIEKLLFKVIEQNYKEWERLLNGEQKLIGFITGKTMALCGGKIDPVILRDVINKKINHSKNN